MRTYTILYAIPLALLSQAATAQCTAQCPISGALAKTEWSAGYNAAIPLGEMGTNANTVHSFAMGGFYRIPQSQGKADVGLELITGSYASFTRTQTFGINGVETPVDVKYNSNVTTTTAVFRYNYVRTNGFTAFAAMRGGFAGFSSKILLEDPNDPEGCKPLDENKLISDYTWVAGVRTGANVDMQRFIKKLPSQTIMFQTYVGYLHGGNVDYINIKNTTPDDPSIHSHATTTADGRPVDVRFVNLQTGTLHTHEVARVYTSPVQFLECAVSMVLRF